ncbi:MAG: hypothetical protein ACRC20_02555 [Segniliparus sp.]|uniref:hypothetical protein n=1 Tax=Segniliparus sp. TaxID=2804064 RepID=UPI003F358E1A
MESDDRPDDAPREADPPTSEPPLIAASGLGVDGEHGPLFSGVDLELGPGFHAVQMPGGTGQSALLLTLAGRLKPHRGTLSVLGDTRSGTIRKHSSIAAFADIDELEGAVTVRTVLAEQRRWLAPWYSSAPLGAAEAVLADVFGEVPVPPAAAYVTDLTDLELFLLRVSLALLPDRPILVVGDLEQVRDNGRRAVAADRLGEIAKRRTVVVGVTNPLGEAAPEHNLHDHRILTGKD